MSPMKKHIQQIFSAPTYQKRFEEYLLRRSDEAYIALHILLDKGAEPESLEFFLMATAGYLAPFPQAAKQLPQGPSINDVKETSNDIWGIAHLIAEISDLGNEDAFGPAEFLIKTNYTAPDETESPAEAIAHRMRRRKAIRCARAFKQLPAILDAFAKTLEPWWESFDHRQGHGAVQREYLKVHFYVYCRQLAKLPQSQVSALLLAGRYAVMGEKDVTRGIKPLDAVKETGRESLKSILSRFRTSHRAQYDEMVTSVKHYYEVKKGYPQTDGISNSSYVCAAGYVDGNLHLWAASSIDPIRHGPKVYKKEKRQK